MAGYSNVSFSTTSNSVTISATVINDLSFNIFTSVHLEGPGLSDRIIHQQVTGSGRTGTISTSYSGLSPGSTYSVGFGGVDEDDQNQVTDSRFGYFSYLQISRSGSFTTNVPAPSWTDQTLAASARVGTHYASSISASYATSYSFLNLPPGISQASSNSQNISGTPTSSGNYSVSFSASNSTGTISGSDNINVLPRLPVFTDNDYSDTMRVGEEYNESVSASYVDRWEASGNLLSNGISFADGQLLGTPNSSGSYEVTVSIYNSANESSSFSDTFNVLPRIPVWTDEAISTSFEVGTQYSDAIAANYAVAYELTSGTLPDGISLDTNTGALTGVPTTLAAYTFKLGARNSANEYIYTQQYNVTVQESGGNLGIYNGSSWNESEVYVYLNGSWTRGRVYVYDGNEWIKSAQI